MVYWFSLFFSLCRLEGLEQANHHLISYINTIFVKTFQFVNNYAFNYNKSLYDIFWIFPNLSRVMSYPRPTYQFLLNIYNISFKLSYIMQLIRIIAIIKSPKHLLYLLYLLYLMSISFISFISYSFVISYITCLFPVSPVYLLYLPSRRTKAKE